MDGIIEFVKSIINSLNPTLVEFSNSEAAFGYVARVIAALIVLAIVIYCIRNFRKFVRFLRDTYQELRKVDWLSRADTIKFSVITLAMLVGSTLFIMGVDRVFLAARNLILGL